MAGESSEVPGWVLVLGIAKEYGLAPWEVEEQCSQEWWERILLMNKIENERANKSSGT